MYRLRSSPATRGFTLIELLITVGILAVLATLTVLVINPVELFRQARDAQRLNDMEVLTKTIVYAMYGGMTIGSPEVIYNSVPASPGPCVSAPAPAGSWTYNCPPTASYQKVDGTGWIPVDFSNPFGAAELGRFLAVAGGGSTDPAQIRALPVDPINTAASGYSYQYLTNADTFQLVSRFESEKYQPKAQEDGGHDPARYETGATLVLWKAAIGL